MLVGLFLVACLAVAEACPPCDPNSCPKEPERDCPLGGAPDPCECCRLGTCGLAEGQPCYNATVYKGLPDRRRLGSCASNMVCLLRNDLEPKDGLETVCLCAEQRIACGSDNKTYESTCKMYQVENNKRVTLQHWGPCHHEEIDLKVFNRVESGHPGYALEFNDTKTSALTTQDLPTTSLYQFTGFKMKPTYAPQVSSGPENVESVLGQPALLACEAKGFPVPSITWEYQANDGSVVVLPGDDPLVSVQLRGGPEHLMVSSWVQLTQSRQTDTGTYSCVAANHLGSARASAYITVQQKQ